MKERNAGHSTETEKVIRTTDRGHPALGPFRTVVRQHRVDQRRAILWPGRFNLRSEGRYGLLGSLETHLAGFDVVLAGGDGHLPHDEFRGVGLVFLCRHSSRFVGALPNQDFIAMGSAGGGPAADTPFDSLACPAWRRLNHRQ